MTSAAATTTVRRAARRHYDVIIVGAGIAGSLVAKKLGCQGWDVLVLEAGNGGTDTWPGYLDSVNTFRGTVAKVPNSAYRPNVAAPSPDVLDLLPEGMGYRAGGYLRQNGELPYSTDYLRVLGGSGMHWLGAAPRMLVDRKTSVQRVRGATDATGRSATTPSSPTIARPNGSSMSPGTSRGSESWDTAFPRATHSRWNRSRPAMSTRFAAVWTARKSPTRSRRRTPLSR